MTLKVVFEDQVYQVGIPDDVLRDGGAFFQRMNADMDKGWQMGREWVDKPNAEQRCQIAASRLVDAISNDNETLAGLMAGYIMAQRPGTKEVQVATTGDLMETTFL